MENISIKSILDRALCLEQNNLDDNYNISYSYFLKYFSDKEQLTEQDLIIGANFTYGWMPTILNFKSKKFVLAVSILNSARSSNRISDEDLLTLVTLINNSLVGVSKLLHFVNPNVYAIWDSRVCNFLTGKSYNQKVQNIDLFWSYLDLCKRVSADPEFVSIHRNYIKKIKFKITPMRTVEQIMFINSDKPLVL